MKIEKIEQRYNDMKNQKDVNQKRIMTSRLISVVPLLVETINAIMEDAEFSGCPYSEVSECSLGYQNGCGDEVDSSEKTECWINYYLKLAEMNMKEKKHRHNTDQTNDRP